jgi:hypothetical protein
MANLQKNRFFVSNTPQIFAIRPTMQNGLRPSPKEFSSSPPELRRIVCVINSPGSLVEKILEAAARIAR